jgi:hypothetical protein
MTCYLVYCLKKNHDRYCYSSFEYKDVDDKFKQYTAMNDFICAYLYEVNLITGKGEIMIFK